MTGSIQQYGNKFDPTNIAAQDTVSVDAFNRWRVSNPFAIFDSKQLSDNQPLFWDDQEVSGTGTGSTHSAATAASTLSVGTGAGNRTRQTFQRFNYQPGKSMEILMTGVLNKSGGGTGIIQRIGYFDDSNGLFFENNEGTINVVQRSKTSGSVVDTTVAQTSWNLDAMDGTGPSGMTMDWTKTQIFIIDFEWLGVGRVRMGMSHDGRFVYSHEFNNDNTIAVPYMSTPNLPLRYEISNDGSGAASTLLHICGTVVSEGGREDNGILRYKSTGGTEVDADVANTIYALVGIKLKAAYLGTTINIESFSVLAETNDDFEWLLYWNPTVADTFTYGNLTNSAVQTATGALANTITGGTVITGGFGASTKDGGTEKGALINALRLGSNIAGTVDEIVLCVRPLSANANIQGSLTWRELS